jgi:hypothetical protein
MSLRGIDLPAIALARPPSASPQTNAGRAQARQAGTTEAISRGIQKKRLPRSLQGVYPRVKHGADPEVLKGLAMTKSEYETASREEKWFY